MMPSTSPNDLFSPVAFGALKRAMAKTGYENLKDFQKVGLTVRG